MVSIDESTNSIIMELLKPMQCLWVAEFYEGDAEYNSCGRRINPVVFRAEKYNLITTTGKQLMIDRLLGLGGAAAIAGTAVGTSGTAAAIGDTAITGAVYKVFNATPTRTGLTATAITSYTTAEANIAIAEAGTLNGSGATLFNRVAPFANFTKTTAFGLDITTTYTQA